MAIGGWRQGIPRKRRRRAPPPPPPPPAGTPVLTGYTPEQAEGFKKQNDNLQSTIHAIAGTLEDRDAAHRITSSMDAQNKARNASGQTATVK